MNKQQAEAITKYVDAAIEYALTREDVEWSGITERKAMESAKDELMKA